MHRRIMMAVAAALLGLTGSALAAAPQQCRYKVSEIEHLTCREAWRKANKSADTFIDMSRALADSSLKERKLVMPQEQGAGMKLGRAIVDGCVADPEEFLSSVVDRGVRNIGHPQ